MGEKFYRNLHELSSTGRRGCREGRKEEGENGKRERSSAPLVGKEPPSLVARDFENRITSEGGSLATKGAKLSSPLSFLALFLPPFSTSPPPSLGSIQEISLSAKMITGREAWLLG